MRLPARRRPAIDDATLGWLLDGDPSIRFGTRTLLGGEPEAAAGDDRAAIARRGWGRRLLAARARSGRWGDGLYLPKWTSTHYTLLQLMGLGVEPTHPACQASARLLLDEGFTDDGGISFWASRASDDCVTAMVLAMLVYFAIDDPRVDRLVDGLLDAELDGGGWNCRRWSQTPRCASIHTTLSVLEAFDECARAGRRHRARDRAAAVARGRQVLLARRLYQVRSTGQPIDRKVTTFTYPPRWRFDVLRCLYGFARAGVPWDDRMGDALALIEARRGDDGRWPATAEHPGLVHLRMETPRAPGRWNTLRAAVVLQRYGAAR